MAGILENNGSSLSYEGRCNFTEHKNTAPLFIIGTLAWLEH